LELNKILSSLSYFSILFAGIVFPLIVWLAAEDKEVKGHAKKAFFSHLIPLVPMPILLFGFLHELIAGDPAGTTFPVIFFLSIAFIIILSMIVFVWNIVKGIKVLR
jgi:Domain of unknown function (DUF4870)